MDNAPTSLDMHQQIVSFIKGGQPFAMALILKAAGSTPQKLGVRAIIDAAGKIHNTIGGGLVEAEGKRRAVEACKSQQPVIYEFPMDNAYSRDAGAICGGTMRVLIDPGANQHRQCYEQAAQALVQRRRGVLITTLENSPAPKVSVQWYGNGDLPAEMGFPGIEAVRKQLQAETPKLFVENSEPSGVSLEVLVEPIVPSPTLMIVGGGHVGQALAHQAVVLGFEVTVIDDRKEFTDGARFPAGVTTHCGHIPSIVAESEIGPETYIVVVTRGHKDDAECMEVIIHRPAAYIGMIGSARKVTMLRKGFLESGLSTKEEFDRVYAPIGFDIGALTVEEIATSITAELVAVRRKGKKRVRPGERGWQ